MEDYEVVPDPFFVGESVRLHQAASLRRNRQPVIIKYHDFYLADGEFIEKINHTLNAGLAQARVEHQNTCKILEMNLEQDRKKGLFTVCFVMEALQKDVSKLIEEMKEADRGLTEAGLAEFLIQTSHALTYAHSKEIAHRDIKPQNILLDPEGTYKICDFGCFYQKKATLHTVSQAGTLPYMSPQQRQIISGLEIAYDAFKSDVFGLGMTAVSFATMNLPISPWSLEELEEKGRTAVRGIRSQRLQDLLLSMLSIEERCRPTMRSVYEALVPSVGSGPDYLETCIQLRNTLAEVHFQARQYAEMVPICEETLNRWGESPYTFELLRALFYLAEALYLQSSTSRGNDLVKKWCRKLPAKSPPSQCVLHLIQACKLQESNQEEAARLFEQGLEQLLPSSFLTAVTRHSLSYLYVLMKRPEQAEGHCLRACEIFSTSFPQSYQYANCLSCLGYLYHYSHNSPKPAEQQYLQACDLFSARFPHTPGYADCLFHLGTLYADTENKDLAVQKLEAALALYVKNAKQDKVTECEALLHRLHS